MITKGCVEVKSKARVTFSRYTGFSESGWNLTVTDEASGQLICELKLTPEQFSNVMGSCSTDVDATFFVSDRIGKKMEHTTILVPYSNRSFGSDDGWKKLCAEAERIATEQGYILDSPGKYNHHRHSNGQYSFIARKWV